MLILFIMSQSGRRSFVNHAHGRSLRRRRRRCTTYELTPLLLSTFVMGFFELSKFDGTYWITNNTLFLFIFE